MDEQELLDAFELIQAAAEMGQRFVKLHRASSGITQLMAEEMIRSARDNVAIGLERLVID